MKTIEFDDELVAETLRITGAKSEREAIESALRLQLQLGKQKEVLSELWGSFDWQGDLDDLRLNRDRNAELSVTAIEAIKGTSARAVVVEEVRVGKDTSERIEAADYLLTMIIVDSTV